MKNFKDFLTGAAWGLVFIFMVVVLKHCTTETFAHTYNYVSLVDTVDSNIVYIQGVALDLNIMNNYCQGWEDGYEDGYCSNQQAGCIKPQVPVCPSPKINEDPGYKGGYWRGFKAGDAKWKKEHE